MAEDLACGCRRCLRIADRDQLQPGLEMADRDVILPALRGSEDAQLGEGLDLTAGQLAAASPGELGRSQRLRVLGHPRCRQRAGQRESGDRGVRGEAAEDILTM